MTIRTEDYFGEPADFEIIWATVCMTCTRPVHTCIATATVTTARTAAVITAIGAVLHTHFITRNLFI